MSANPDSAKPQPLWDGLTGEDEKGPFLVGGRCSHCGFVTLGVRDLCPSCWTRNAMTPAPIGRTGRLYSFTVIHQLPEGYTEPYAVGYLDIEGEIRVFAHIRQDPASLAIGKSLALAVAPLRKDRAGNWLTGPRYGAAEIGG